MKFEEYPLVIPNIEEFTKRFKKLLTDFQKGQTAKEQSLVMKKISKVSKTLQTQMTVIEVRYTLNTLDEVYEKAQEVIDETSPLYQALFVEYNKAVVASKYRKELEKEYGSYYFEMLENSLKTFDDKIIPEMQLENKYRSQYTKLISSAQIKFDGGVYNLSQLGKFTESSNRDVRKRAAMASWKFFEKNEKEIADIYTQLVKVRHEMAIKLGYKNFVEFGYARLGRTDYDAKMVQNYREQIYRVVVPFTKKLFKSQAKRLGIKNPQFYDYNISFLSGNPTPIGTTDELVAKAKIMYHEMSPETDEFFNFMIDNHLMDLEARKGKSGGGYMTFFPDYKSPFIFANFNGTKGDVDVLTHEVGHAFQGYCSRNIAIQEYQSPTFEACEIHSMSMEFFAWPWMESFFAKDAEKYRFVHLTESICFLPYGVSIDEFQHFVYENPQATHEERCNEWLRIQKKYLPHRKYAGCNVGKRGGIWMRQSHVFGSPFYYIDYTLAQVSAFQFLVEMEKNRVKAWKKYFKLCKLGGKYPYVSLLKHAKLHNPFADGNVAKIIRPLKKVLAKFDEAKMK